MRYLKRGGNNRDSDIFLVLKKFKLNGFLMVLFNK